MFAYVYLSFISKDIIVNLWKHARFLIILIIWATIKQSDPFHQPQLTESYLQTWRLMPPIKELSSYMGRKKINYYYKAIW